MQHHKKYECRFCVQVKMAQQKSAGTAESYEFVASVITFKETIFCYAKDIWICFTLYYVCL
jgi:hypothetical protein